mmetsp:Transcript_3225/g.10663  ORF Transcript_3225/g.10663 Transcript_3225/m.10663 type:complete len:233 (-) Transcript_3225:288-986(-)
MMEDVASLRDVKEASGGSGTTLRLPLSSTLVFSRRYFTAKSKSDSSFFPTVCCMVQMAYRRIRRSRSGTPPAQEMVVLRAASRTPSTSPKKLASSTMCFFWRWLIAASLLPGNEAPRLTNRSPSRCSVKYVPRPAKPSIRFARRATSSIACSSSLSSSTLSRSASFLSSTTRASTRWSKSCASSFGSRSRRIFSGAKNFEVPCRGRCRTVPFGIVAAAADESAASTSPCVSS